MSRVVNRVVSTSAYLQIRIDPRRPWGTDGKVVKVTQKKPERPEAGCVVVKVKVNIPRAAFEPLAPSVEIDIPEDLVQHPVLVEAVASDE